MQEKYLLYIILYVLCVNIKYLVYEKIIINNLVYNIYLYNI